MRRLVNTVAVVHNHDYLALTCHMLRMGAKIGCNFLRPTPQTGFSKVITAIVMIKLKLWPAQVVRPKLWPN